LLILMLIAAPAAARAELLPGAELFDLAKMDEAAGCGRTGSEIVVCGRRKNDEIIVRDGAGLEGKPLKAEVRLPSGVTLDVHGEQHTMPDGRSGPAAMVRVTIPF
jgi:hypothetical protein